jgi:hypothetical protein
MASALAAVLLLAAAADAAVTLSLKDNMRLPFEYAGKELSGDKTYAVDEGVAEKNAFLGPFVFVVGENSLLQVVDTTEYKTAESKIVAIFDIGRPGTDVATCSTLSEDLLAVATQGAGGKQSAGIVHIFSVNMTTGGVTHLRQVPKQTYPHFPQLLCSPSPACRGGCLSGRRGRRAPPPTRGAPPAPGAGR